MESGTVVLSADDLIGGQPCLDFVNTAGGGAKARGNERLLTYEALSDWAKLAGLISARATASLHRLAKASPDDAVPGLERARRFREALHAVLKALATGGKVPEDCWQAVTSQITQCLALSGLMKDAAGFKRSIDVEQGGLDTILLRVGLLANDLLLSDDLRLLKNCDRCSWLYLDRSKGRRRRWCSMRACGNRAKVQRFAKRQRDETGL